MSSVRPFQVVSDLRVAMKVILWVGAILLAASQAPAFAEHAATGSFVRQARLTASNAAADDRFGQSVAIDDDIVLIGAPYDDHMARDAGSVYVFLRDRRTGLWSEVATLTAADAVAGQHFGQSVSLSDGVAIIGSTGAAYIFAQDRQEDNAWTQVTKLLPADRTTVNSYFGTSVSIDGNTAVVGAPFSPNRVGFFGEGLGAVYVFKRHSRPGSVWEEAAKLTAAYQVPPLAPTSFDFFGVDVDLDRGRIIVGALEQFTNDFNTPIGPAAYIFEERAHSEWDLVGVLDVPNLGVIRTTPSRAVAISGDAAIVAAGAEFFNAPAAVYVFERDQHGSHSWRVRTRFEETNVSDTPGFGVSVDIDGDVAIIGSPVGRFGSPPDPDAAYVFRRVRGLQGHQDGWVFVATLTGDPTAEIGPSSITAVAISGKTAVVGTLNDDALGIDAGAAYVYVAASAAKALQALTDYITSLALDPSVREQFLAFLRVAQVPERVDQPGFRAAALNAFIAEVAALERAGRLAPDVSANLTALANAATDVW